MKRATTLGIEVAIFVFIVLAWVALFSITVRAQNTRPVLVASGELKEFFEVTFDQGSYGVEFTFKMLDPHPDFPKGYAPVKAWFDTHALESITTNWSPIKPFDNEWDVFVRVYYSGGELTGPTFVESNHLRVHR